MCAVPFRAPDHDIVRGRPLRNADDRATVGQLGSEVFGGMNGDVGAPLEHLALDLAGEQPLAGDRVKGARVPVAPRRNDHDVRGDPRMHESHHVRDRLGLPKGEARSTAGDDKCRGKGLGAHLWSERSVVLELVELAQGGEVEMALLGCGKLPDPVDRAVQHLGDD